jgi:hypothetical protein
MLQHEQEPQRNDVTLFNPTDPDYILALYLADKGYAKTSLFYAEKAKPPILHVSYSQAGSTINQKMATFYDYRTLKAIANPAILHDISESIDGRMQIAMLWQPEESSLLKKRYWENKVAQLQKRYDDFRQFREFDELNREMQHSALRELQAAQQHFQPLTATETLLVDDIILRSIHKLAAKAFKL